MRDSMSYTDEATFGIGSTKSRLMVNPGRYILDPFEFFESWYCAPGSAMLGIYLSWRFHFTSEHGIQLGCRGLWIELFRTLVARGHGR